MRFSVHSTRLDSPLKVADSLIHQPDAGGERDGTPGPLLVGQMETMDAADPNRAHGRSVPCTTLHGIFERRREDLDLLPEDAGRTAEMLRVRGQRERHGISGFAFASLLRFRLLRDGRLCRLWRAHFGLGRGALFLGRAFRCRRWRFPGWRR